MFGAGRRHELLARVRRILLPSGLDTATNGDSGITNAFTSATTPDNSVFASNQFLIYDHKEGAARHEVVYEQSSNRYLHGSLDHLDIGSGHGFLISLMSQQAPASVPQGDEEGQDASLESNQSVVISC